MCPVYFLKFPLTAPKSFFSPIDKNYRKLDSALIFSARKIRALWEKWAIADIEDFSDLATLFMLPLRYADAVRAYRMKSAQLEIQLY
jgi:hypothetical protein